MKKCIIYSVTIYLIFIMIIIIQKPKILCDEYGNFKSWEYFKGIVKNGIDDLSDLICLPTVLMIGSLLSFFLAKYLAKSSLKN